MKIREKYWLWGQTAGCQHSIKSGFGMPGISRMTPLEGAYYFGIPNMCMVLYGGRPQPPFDFEADKLESLDNVVWSIVGDGSSGQMEYTDAVIEVSKTHKNIVGGIMDDIFRERRMKVFTPESIGEFRKKLHTEGDRELPLWAVIYEYELFPDRKPYINECDILTLWHWDANQIPNIEQNVEKLKSFFEHDQKVYCGCYLWDYGNTKPMPKELMQLQLDTYERLMREGKIEGVIVCSNCCADIDLEASYMMHDYLKEHGDKEI